jgi:adenine-specific DNA-methyltransferase
MHKLTTNDPGTRSPDLVEEGLAQLRSLFPEVVTEGADGMALNLDVLKQLLGDRTVTDAEEKYGLNWHGKRRARQLSLTPSTGTLRPCPEDSVDWDKTQNLLIEGDNLEVLKLLQKSYAGKIKLVYIDPPYNTGKDFVYPDNFQDNIKNYLDLTGQTGKGGKKLSSNTESSGRFHTDWLNMMYPRVKLSRNLLKEDGIIFVSIADHEVHNLRSIMDEVFGPENFIATVIWQKVFSPKNSARHFSEDHDYIVVYARNAETWKPNLLPRTEEMEARYGNPDNDPRGSWTSGDLSARNYYSEGTYPITSPSGRAIQGPPPGTYWRVSKEKFDELDRDNRIWWGTNGGNIPRLKRFLSDVQAGRVPQTLWTYDEVGHTQEAKKELMAAVNFPSSEYVFDTVKPTRLIQRILQLSTSVEEPEIVLDFFAGTGSTMDAVFIQNAKDGGKRRCFLVQFPEPLTESGSAGWANIADITRARVSSAGKRIRGAAPAIEGDVGFRVFRLASSNILAWEPTRANLDQALEASVEHLKTDRTEQDILFELLLKLGLDLCVPIAVREVDTGANKVQVIHSIGGGALLVCLSPLILRTEVEPLALGLVAWHQVLMPAGETSVVFRDSAFADDVAKTNLTAILQQHGLGTVRSL